MIDPALVPALRDVLTVAQTGSVAAAARRLYKTPSAVSQQMRRVEAHFGVAIFERDGRGVRPSAAGETALVAVARLFDEIEAAFGVLTALSGHAATTLRVAASDYLGKGLLLPVIRRLFAEDAGLRFEITTMHSIAAPRSVARGDVDFAVVTTTETTEGLLEKRLFRQPFFWVGPHRRGDTRSLRERLRDEPVLRLSAGSQGRRLLDAFLEAQRVRPVSTIDVPSASLLLSYASGGIGIGLAPALAVAEAPRMRIQTEPAQVSPLPVKVVWRANYRLTAPLERFVQRIAAAGHEAAQRIRNFARTAPER
ncbi:MAG TPA: LysR family transcriptional regulator [Polyangiaceae bacterium]|nr:LysR family transcriptional regulator [Polyangiaceae bacterium]